MNKKGFSLTEILVVIAIIAIILAIAIPAIPAIRRSINRRTYETKKQEILAYAEIYAKDHPDVFVDGGLATITIQTLLNEDYLESDTAYGQGNCKDESSYQSRGCVINPMDDSVMNENEIVIVTRGSSYSTYWGSEYNISDVNLVETVKTALNCTNVTEANPCMYGVNADDNYLLNSGVMWRILGVYLINNVEVVKMVTDNTISWEEL